MLRVCYFGTYSLDEGYPRNRVIIEGLRRNGVEVIECHEDFWQGTEEKLEGLKRKSLMAKKIWSLIKIYARLYKKFRKIGHYDAIIVGYAGHIDIFLAKILNFFRRKPLLFDAFLSLYDTAVMDRRIVSPCSVKAWLLRQVDKWSCRMADAVLLDTQAHIDFFVKEFNLSRGKFFYIPVGSSLKDTSHNVSKPLSLPPSVKNKIKVLFFGSYIPLHGIDTILKAAEILRDEKDMVFILVGKGQLLGEMKSLASTLKLDNVIFIDRFVSEEELVRYIKESDICLGIFGVTDKALRVIPCKVYNCLALGKPLITARTSATEGVLRHGENIFLCNPGDPIALSEAIEALKNNDTFREMIGRHGAEYFRQFFSAEAIGEKVLSIVKLLVRDQ